MQSFAETSITHVSIYRTGCFITRCGTVHLPSGDGRILIGPLGYGADRTTLRLSMSSGVSLNRLDISQSILERDEVDDSPEVEAKREEIAALEATIENREFACEAWRNSVSADAPLGKGAKIASFIEELPGRLDALGAEIRKMNKEKERLEEELDALRRAAAGVGSASVDSNKSYVEADVVVAEEGDFALELVYWDRDASWTPSYRITAPSLDDQIELDLRGQMSQHTGENWNGVSVELFTGDPAKATSLPEIRTRYLEFEREVVKNRLPAMGGGGFAMRAVVADEAMADYSEPVEKLEMSTATMQEHETMNSYALPGTWTVPSGSEGVFVDISRTNLDVDYRLTTFPEADAGVYITAQLKDDAPVEMLSCAASIHLGESYIGSIGVNSLTLTEDSPLSLGRDDRLSASRTLVSRKTSSQLLKGQTRTEYEYEFEVSNRRAREASVSLVALIPVPREDEITVEALNLSNGSHDTETGEVRWTLDIAANAKSTVRLAYAVTAPKKRVIVERLDPSKAPAPSYSDGFCHQCGSPIHGQIYCPNCGARC